MAQVVYIDRSMMKTNEIRKALKTRGFQVSCKQPQMGQWYCAATKAYPEVKVISGSGSTMQEALWAAYLAVISE